jgi:hypothetical protein
MNPFRTLPLAALCALVSCSSAESTIDSAINDMTPSETKADVATCPPAGAAACVGGTAANGTACEYTGSNAVIMHGTAKDFQSERELANTVVHIIDNATGLPTGICGVTDSQGRLDVKVAKGKTVGYATAIEGAKNTYHFNVKFNEDGDEDFLSVSDITAQLIPGIIGRETNSEMGTVAGTVYNKYGDPVTDTASEKPMKVSTVSGSDAYYFNDKKLPVNLADQPALNPQNALFVAFDLAPGAQSLKLTYGGAVSDVTSNTLVAFPDAVAITNIVCASCTK